MKRYFEIAAICILVVVFAATGLLKLVYAASFQEQFARFGLPEWFVYFTGGVELLGAVLVTFFKQLPRRIGAAMLATAMAVATALHLIYDPVAVALPASVLMLLAGYVAMISNSESATRGTVGA